MTSYEIDGVSPVVHATAFVHPQASLIGDVIIGSGCYVGPMASLRGDFGRIEVGEGSNVQDGCAVHCFPGADTILEPGSHIGHGAILHGCHVCSKVLVGMNAVVMDGVVVGAESLIGAGSFAATDRHGVFTAELISKLRRAGLISDANILQRSRPGEERRHHLVEPYATVARAMRLGFAQTMRGVHAR